MSRKDKHSDLVARQSEGKSSISQRIEQRIKVLRAWQSEGTPTGLDFPRSLNAARKWCDPELGIESISSPNEFTTTHPIFGDRVKRIAEALTELKARASRLKKQSKKSAHAEPVSSQIRVLREQLAAAVDQWHMERELLLTEQRRANSAEARSAMLIREISQKEALIADLRRQLSEKNGLRVV